MTIRTVFAVVLMAAVVGGCTSPSASPSTSPASTPTVTVTTSSPASTPTPTATQMTAGPLTVPGEIPFGSDNFGGVAWGLPAADYSGQVGSVHDSACGDAVSPMLFADNPSTPPWGLFLMTNWQDPNVAPGSETVQAFELVVQAETVPTTQIGPVGPLGLRLGTPESVIEAMFPVEAGATTLRYTTVLIFATDTEEQVAERVFTIQDVGGGPMIITTVDGYVVTIMWGNPAYVYPQNGRLRCTS